MYIKNMELQDLEMAMKIEKFSKLASLRLKQGENEKALSAYRIAFNSSRQISGSAYMQRACAFNYGAMLTSLGQYQQGLSILEGAIPPEGVRDGKSNGDLYFNRALAFEGLKNKDEALASYELAFKEYEEENENLKSKAEVLLRMSHLNIEKSEFERASNSLKQAGQLYQQAKDFSKYYQVQNEQIRLLAKMNKFQEAEETADLFLSDLSASTQQLEFASVYMSLGLFYTQVKNYAKACECGELALVLVESSSQDMKLTAVIYQNLGAVYNFMKKYDKSIKFHNNAAEKYAEMKNRRSQGHCFLNMGYAYSQLSQFDQAGESFLHAHQAAQDAKDQKTEWQSLEALGTIHLKNRNFQKALECFKKAIEIVSSSSETDKLTIKQRIASKMHSFEGNSYQETSPSLWRAHSRKLMAMALGKSEEDLKEPSSSGQAVKRMQVRRKGTLNRFQKVAVGLDTNFDEDTEEIESEASVQSSSSSELNQHSSPKSMLRPQDSFLPVSGRKSRLEKFEEENKSQDISEDSGGSDDEEKQDLHRIHTHMQQLADAGPLDYDSFTQAESAAAGGEEAPEEEEEDGESSSDASSDSSESSLKPPVPVQPPPENTLTVGTYEKPKSRTIEHDQGTGKKGEKNVGVSCTSPSDLDGFNYFHAFQKDNKFTDKSQKENVRSGTYELLPTLGNNAQDISAVSDNESEAPPLPIPRSEMEIALFDAHMKNKRAKETSDAITYESTERNRGQFEAKNSPNKSKHCILM